MASELLPDRRVRRVGVVMDMPYIQGWVSVSRAIEPVELRVAWGGISVWVGAVKRLTLEVCQVNE